MSGASFVEREVRASLVIVREVPGQDAAQVSFAEDANMIQTLAPDRAGAVTYPTRLGRNPAKRARSYLGWGPWQRRVATALEPGVVVGADVALSRLKHGYESCNDLD